MSDIAAVKDKFADQIEAVSDLRALDDLSLIHI